MCLQWCHVNQWVIDNDYPCRGCVRYPYSGQGAVGGCATCRHRHDGNAGALCNLTAMPVPTTGGCCHYHAEPAPMGAIPLADLPLAPWVLDDAGVGDVRTLLWASETAPDVVEDGGQSVIDTADLAIPLVYGVVASTWDAVLPPIAARPFTPPPPHVDAALAVLTALAEGGDVGASWAALAGLLADTPASALTGEWQKIVEETVTLVEQQAAVSMAEETRR